MDQFALIARIISKSSEYWHRQRGRLNVTLTTQHYPGSEYIALWFINGIKFNIKQIFVKWERLQAARSHYLNVYVDMTRYVIIPTLELICYSHYQ